MMDVVRGDQGYGFAVALNHADPYQGKFNDAEGLEGCD